MSAPGGWAAVLAACLVITVTPVRFSGALAEAAVETRSCPANQTVQSSNDKKTPFTIVVNGDTRQWCVGKHGSERYVLFDAPSHTTVSVAVATQVAAFCGAANDCKWQSLGIKMGIYNRNKKTVDFDGEHKRKVEPEAPPGGGPPTTRSTRIDDLEFRDVSTVVQWKNPTGNTQPVMLYMHNTGTRFIRHADIPLAVRATSPDARNACLDHETAGETFTAGTVSNEPLVCIDEANPTTISAITGKGEVAVWRWVTSGTTKVNVTAFALDTYDSQEATVYVSTAAGNEGVKYIIDPGAYEITVSGDAKGDATAGVRGTLSYVIRTDKDAAIEEYKGEVTAGGVDIPTNCIYATTRACTVCTRGWFFFQDACVQQCLHKNTVEVGGGEDLGAYCASEKAVSGDDPNGLRHATRVTEAFRKSVRQTANGGDVIWYVGFTLTARGAGAAKIPDRLWAFQFENLLGPSSAVVFVEQDPIAEPDDDQAVVPVTWTITVLAQTGTLLDTAQHVVDSVNAYVDNRAKRDASPFSEDAVLSVEISDPPSSGAKKPDGVEDDDDLWENLQSDDPKNWWGDIVSAWNSSASQRALIAGVGVAILVSFVLLIVWLTHSKCCGLCRSQKDEDRPHDERKLLG